MFFAAFFFPIILKSDSVAKFLKYMASKEFIAEGIIQVYTLLPITNKKLKLKI